MTRTIKELMRLLSYEQNLKSLKLKRASIDAKFAKRTVHELRWRVLFISIFEFEYKKHRTIKRDAKLRSGDAIVSRLEANKQNHDTMQSLTLILKFSVGVGSSDPHRKCLVSSDKRFSARWKYWVGSSDPPSRRSCIVPDKTLSAVWKWIGQKFRPCVGSSDKHIKLQQRLVFEGPL